MDEEEDSDSEQQKKNNVIENKDKNKINSTWNPNRGYKENPINQTQLQEGKENMEEEHNYDVDSDSKEDKTVDERTFEKNEKIMLINQNKQNDKEEIHPYKADWTWYNFQ